MRRLKPALLVALAIGASCLLAQTHPNLERGVDPVKAYQIGDVDSVNLFNGGLSLAIPLGQTYSVGGDLSYAFVLRYTSNFWNHNLRTFVNDCAPPYETITVTETTPDVLDSGLNAGLGWTMGFGALLVSGSGQTLSTFTYVEPDGRTHRFHASLHCGETERAGTLYTRDGSYMRLVASGYSDGSSCPGGWLAATVELADGRRQLFSRGDTCAPFQLASEVDRFGNSLSFTEDLALDRWVIQDSQGRTHYVRLRWLLGFQYRVIDSVDLAAFGQQRAVYSFAYATRTIARSCKHYYDPGWETCDPQLQPTVGVPLLTAVTLPDGSRWTMLDATEPGYNVDGIERCAEPGFPKDQPGTLTHLQAPTGGSWRWTYATWTNPEGGAACYSSPFEVANVKDATGVTMRTLGDPFGATALGTWTYLHDAWRLGSGGVDPSSQESWTTVTTPEGDQSTHYFRTQFCGLPYEGWDYGLPFTRGRYGTALAPFLSSEQFDGWATEPGSLRRSHHLTFDKDSLDPAWPAHLLQQSNRRVAFEKTVFADDPVAGGTGLHEASVSRDRFDGLGHFRDVLTTGTFGPSRTTSTEYNPGLTYPAPSAPADWWPSSSPWVINTYASTNVGEAGEAAKVEACFDPLTGYLERTRDLEATGAGGGAPPQGVRDVIHRRTQTGGNTTREEWFGGDTQPVGTGPLCSLALPTPSYRVDHTYQYGGLGSSRYVDASGTPVPFFSVDRDIDASTGLTLTSRDVSGLSSSHRYDSLGRLTEWNGPARYDAGHGKAAAKPASGPWIQYCYRPAVAPWIPAAVETSWWGDMDIRFGCGQVSDAPLRRTSVDVEGFGRPWREYRTIFDGTRAQRITEYTSMGSRKSVTEWQPELPSVERKTWYQNYDPFGRPGRVLPPDGSPHDTTFTYAGIRLRSRTVSVATAVGMESSATTTEELDPYGRLARVTEPSGPAGTNTTTAYAYDVGGRLREASTTSGSTTQTRRFVFDNRGFLTSEQLPEAGTFGNGLVLYSRRDARGHARRIQDGAHDVAFTYDAAERLVQVAQADAQGGPGTPVLETFGFGTANAPGNVKLGKLETAFSGNPDVAGASVSETYTYGGPGGRISARRTEVGGRTIDQGFSLGDYGEVLSLSYPDDLAIAAGEDPPQALSMSYGFGALTAVEPYAWYVSYHPNGLVKEVLHSNGMKDLFEKDPYDLPRVASIALQRSADGFVFGSLGPYAYDGLGNVRSIGADWFTYDPVGRLTNGTVSSGSYRQCAAYNAFGSVVGLGTGVPSCTPSPIAVDEATNRLASPVTYDAAGNVTSWGGHTYEWSRLNRMWRTTGAGINESYAYTASGERILERNALDGTETLSIRDLDGKVLREYGRSPSGQWSWTKDYVYRDGTILASMTPSETRHFHVDHLGSVRAATSSAIPPTPIPDTVRDYYPFGLDVFGASDPERMRFAGHQRDTQGTLGQTDDLDYMHARHYSPLLGRFLSIDPGRDQDPAAPQSWNLYAYARNNPLKYVDPDGKENELAWDAMQRDQVREHYGDAAVTRMDQQRAVIGVTALGLLAGGVAAAEWGPGALMLGRELFTRFGDKTERAAAELQAGAFESAAAGGKHGGFLANYASRSLQEIQKGIGSIEKLIATHQDKIANPEKYIKNFKSLDPRQQAALLNSKWPSDIARQREQLQILRRLAEEKLKELK